MTTHYILDEDGRTPIPCPDHEKWAKWYETHWFEGRQVAEDFVTMPTDSIIKAILFSKVIRVSTVFLGLNHNWGEGPPLLWETLIDAQNHDHTLFRYTTYEAAAAGHHTIVAAIRSGGDYKNLTLPQGVQA